MRLSESNAGEQAGPGVGLPAAEYLHRLRLREAEVDRLDRLDLRLGNSRLVVFVLGTILLWPTLVSQTVSAAWLVAPIGVLGVLIAAHGRVVRELNRRRLGSGFYRRGLARISGDWSHPHDDGGRFLPADHPYAEDLDLFGRGSLYGMLCTAHSLPGRETLADWLLRPAAASDIAARHDAARELRGRLDLQEELSLLAAELSPELRADELEAWGTEPRRLAGAAWPLLALILGVVNLAAVLAWIFGPLGGKVLLAILGTSAALALPVRSRVSQVLAGIAMPAGELRFLSRFLARLESESFADARLRELQRCAFDGNGAARKRAGERPSRGLVELAKLIEWNDSRSNLFFRPLSALLHGGTQIAFAVERWRGRHGTVVGNWLRAVGEVEALLALATLSFENPDYVFPEIVTDRSIFEGAALVHPLLPRESRVANDVSLEAGGVAAGASPALLLISGSNMSGKSTLLRTVGVAAVLAFAGAPVPARRLRISPLAIGASLRARDSLLEGVSGFYAELRQLRRIRDLAAAGPTLFLLDEILHGTNSHDRHIGAARVIHGLLGAGALGLVTTHDLALAAVAEELGARAANVHFEDHLEAGRMAFDYKLRPGVVTRGNALALMKSLGL